MSSSEKKLVTNTCKFLGLRTDPRSLASYPSISNCCYGCLPEAVPNLIHQREACLSLEHQKCPVFLAENSIPMPKDLIHKSAQKTNSGIGVWQSLLVVAVVAALVIAAILFLPGILGEPPAETWDLPATNGTATLPAAAAKTNAPQASATPLSSQVDEPSPTAKVTDAPTVSPTATPEIVSLPLESILGTNYKVIVHKVADGESLSSLAQVYRTSDKAILDATYKLIIPLWAGKIIVIPMDIKSWQDQPALEPYQVTQAAATLDDLSQVLGVDAKLLKYYNGCETCIIQQGSWIVVPRAP